MRVPIVIASAAKQSIPEWRFRIVLRTILAMTESETMKTREEIAQALAASGYIADAELATAISLMQLLKRPLLLEGEAGVGKTEVAKALAAAHATELIRLQCYEGLDQSAALYEWNYQRQLLSIQAHRGEDADAIEDQIFSEKYLLERPLLAAIRRDKPPVLLIDEIDRADDEFEAFLLELLSDFQVSIPELGTIKATTIPHVVLTSNGTRELSDALRRRCLYHYVDYPDVDREARIIMARIEGAGASLSLQIARLVEGIRKEELRKVPGVAETLDWAAALVGLDVRDLHDTPEVVHETLMCLLKTHEDKSRVTPRGDRTPAGEGRMSCCGANPGYDELDEVSRLVSTKLAAFLRTLRDNGFAVGLHEGRDAASLMAAGYAAKPGLLRSAFKHLFSARKSDWEKFDGLFDAFWLGKRVRSRSVTMGSAKAANSPSLKSLQRQQVRTRPAARPRPTRSRPPTRRREDRAGEGRMEGASRADNLSEIDFRKMADPEQIAEAHAVAARLAKTMRTRLTRRDLARRRGYRLDLRRTIHSNISHGGVPISLVKRQRKAKAAAAGRAARRLRLDEHVYRRVPALHPRRAGRVSRGRGVPVSHAARLRLRRDEGKGFRPRARSAVDHGAGRRRRHQDRRKPADLQSLACRARDSFANLRDDRVRRLRDRRRRIARPRDGGAGKTLPPHRLAQSDAGVAGLCAGGRRHQGGVAACRSLCARQHAAKPDRARTLSGEAVKEARP